MPPAYAVNPGNSISGRPWRRLAQPRFAIGFISASGAGGAKLLYHHFGEMLENVAAANEFHWMAGNFLKYATGVQKKGRGA
jgi:hypothetical protein